MFKPNSQLFHVGPYSINGDGFLYYEGKIMSVFGMKSYNYMVNGISFVEEKIEDEVKHAIIIDATACFNKVIHEKIYHNENSSFFHMLKWEEYKEQLKEWVCKENQYNKWVNKTETIDAYFKRYMN